MTTLFDKGKHCIVLCPTSDSLTVGLASEQVPCIFPHEIAYRRNGVQLFDHENPPDTEMDTELDIRRETRREVMRELKLPSEDQQCIVQFEKIKDDQTDIDKQDSDSDSDSVLVGEQLKNCSDLNDFEMVSPLQNTGLDKRRSEAQLKNDFCSIWSAAIITCLKISKSEFRNYAIALIVPEHVNVSEVELMMDTLLLEMGMKEAVVHASCTAALLGQGVSGGCVINFEYDSIRILCVEDGVVVSGSSCFLPFGGNHIAETLNWMLEGCHPTTSETKWKPLRKSEINKMRGEGCFLPTEGSEEALETHLKSSAPIKCTRIAQNGQSFIQETILGNSACVAPMGLFYPVLFGCMPVPTLSHTMSSSEAYYTGVLDAQGATKQKNPTRILVQEYDVMGLDSAIVKSISAAEKVDQRRRLYTSILIVGPCSDLRGLSDMLERRVLSALPVDEVIDTVAVSETKWPSTDLIFKGGSVCGILTAPDQWTGQKEWKEGVNLEKPGKYGKTDILRSKAFWMLKTELGLD